MIRDIKESLKDGVDLMTYSQHIPRNTKDLPVWRQVNGKDVKLYTAPVRDRHYTESRLGGRDYSKPSNCEKNSTCGYCPRIYCDDPEKEKDHFYYATGGKNGKYMHVICSQIIEWMKQDCVRLIGEMKDSGQEMDAQAILPWIVEVNKPRCCVDGSCFTCTAPLPKPSCVLDNAARLLQIIMKDDSFHVIDDQQGFLQSMINWRSQTFCRIQFSRLLLTHRSLAFGLTKSPSIFQWLNRVAVSAMNKRGFPTLLYLDDRLLKEKLLRPLEEHETSVGGYVLFCFLVAFGGFVSMGKSHFKPVKKGKFLGFIFDTEKETITVPQSKHRKCCSEIGQFVSGLSIGGIRYFNMKLLEKIRGRIMSWMLVCENWGFFTREMNHTLKKHMARFTGPRAETELMPMSEIDNLSELIEELHLWRDIDYVSLTRKWRPAEHVQLESFKEIYTDASGGGLGSAVADENRPGSFKTRKYAMPLWLAPLAIHVKEAYAVYITINSYGDEHIGKRVVILCDNRSVVDSWEGNGTRDIDMSRILSKIRKKCQKFDIHLTLKWVATDKQAADEPSREMSHVFSRLKGYFGRRLERSLGVNLDLFADPGNVLIEGMRFFAEYKFPSAAGVNGMAYLSQMKTGDVVYAYPPRALSGPFLQVINLN